MVHLSPELLHPIGASEQQIIGDTRVQLGHSF
jgi:hypothetical protein